MRVVKYISFGITAAVMFLGVWGVVIEPRLIDVETYNIEMTALPPEWEGRRIAVIADLQVGMWLDNTGTIERIVATLVAERPDTVLIAGDFVYAPSDTVEQDLRTAIDLLRPLPEAGIPTYAVLGNHDYAVPLTRGPADNARSNRVRQSLEAIGIDVLHNEAIVLRAPGARTQAIAEGRLLYLVGIGPHLPGEDRPNAALAQVPHDAARIVLMHHPNSFAALPAHTAPLAIAGHTHGGQVRIPFTPEWSWVTYVKDDLTHVDGWITDLGQPGNLLYINRGIGFSKWPVRINCQPEITMFTLYSTSRQNVQGLHVNVVR